VRDEGRRVHFGNLRFQNLTEVTELSAFKTRLAVKMFYLCAVGYLSDNLAAKHTVNILLTTKEKEVRLATL
jgi:hypothetical protein